MSKKNYPKVVTANDLLQGDVIYLNGHGAWVRDLRLAAVFESQDIADAALAANTDDVVGAYVIDVQRDINGTDPIHFREDFRATGPSNYRHGKQEQTHV